MYWLAKEEIAHTTKFASLMDLSIMLGSDYLKELNLGRNAHYTSEQTIRELLQCLPSVVEEQILEDIRSSDFFALMTDESTDIAILKQLVLVARYVTKTGVHLFCLLKIFMMVQLKLLRWHFYKVWWTNHWISQSFARLVATEHQ